MSSLNILTVKSTETDLLEELLSEFSAEELNSVARQGAIFTQTVSQRSSQQPRNTQAKRVPFPSSALDKAV